MEFCKQNNYRIDIKDATLIAFIYHHTSTKIAQKNSKRDGDDIFYFMTYKFIIEQLPLMEINCKRSISRRLHKIQNLGLIKIFIDKENGNKIYLTTTEILDKLYCEYSSNSLNEKTDFELEIEGLVSADPMDWEAHKVWTGEDTNNNINNNNINNKEKKIYKKKENDEELFETNNKNKIETYFEDFWKEFQNKVNKKGTLKEFTSIFKKLKEPEQGTLFTVIMDCLKTYNEYIKLGNNKDYIHNPQNWLKKEEYNRKGHYVNKIQTQSKIPQKNNNNNEPEVIQDIKDYVFLHIFDETGDKIVIANDMQPLEKKYNNGKKITSNNAGSISVILNEKYGFIKESKMVVVFLFYKLYQAIMNKEVNIENKTLKQVLSEFITDKVIADCMELYNKLPNNNTLHISLKLLYDNIKKGHHHLETHGNHHLF